MLAFHMVDQKDFTEKLFLKNTFHGFSFTEASFTTFLTHTIDGLLQKDFFDSSQRPQRTYCFWEEVQPQCYTIIKGKRTPLHFKIVFQVSPSYVEYLLEQWGLSIRPEDVFGLYLNCQYDGKNITCTTGTSLKIFTLDKTLDHLWDQTVENFFRQNAIAFDFSH